MRTYNRLLRKLCSTFLKGLGAILPVFVTFYLIYWILAALEHGIGRLLRSFLPEDGYVTGLGLGIGFAVILGVGFLANAYGIERLFALSGKIIDRIPILNTIHGAIRDFVTFFSTSKERKFNQVVCVTVAPNCHLIGFITREEPNGMIDEEPGDEKLIAVYLPMSYQIGGYTLVIPESMTHPIDMSVEDAMKTVFTAGVSTSVPKSATSKYNMPAPEA